MKTDLRPYLNRLVITVVISIVIVAAMNEGFYLLQRENTDRGPQTIELVIPHGTAERVATGEKMVGLPEKMVYVVGDVLEVVNQDSIDHQLGPVWVPPGATGKLELKEPDQYSYSCSFAPGNYLGFDVRQPTTFTTRMTALGVGAPSMAIFLYIYGLLVFPIKPRKAQSGVQA
jgi:hypothetical protein